MLAEVLLEVRGLVKHFPLPGTAATVQACQDVSLTLHRGETLGLVGESGSGKTTLGRCVIRLIEPTGGEIRFDGRDLIALGRRELRELRSEMQMVFQEPQESLNPRMTVGRQVAEPLRIHSDLSPAQRRAQVLALLDEVGLPPDVADVHPRSLSAGAAQRASIARAIATQPKLIVLDEPTSALAPEEEAGIVALLGRLQAEHGIAYIFISHDLSLIGEVSDRIAVMYLSQIVELGDTVSVFADPRMPYTRALLASSLVPDPAQRARRGEGERLAGEIPSPIDLPVGCYLASRCPYVRDRCQTEPQELGPTHDGRLVRCWRVLEGDLDLIALPLAR